MSSSSSSSSSDLSTVIYHFDDRVDAAYQDRRNALYDRVHDLIKAGADVNVVSRNVDFINRHTPLHLAAIEGLDDIVKLLLENEANISAKDAGGNTPLHSTDDIAVATILIDNGASLNVTNKNGHTPLTRHIHNHNYDIAKLLIERGSDVNHSLLSGTKPLHLVACSITDGATEVARLLIQYGADVKAKDAFGRTPLHLIALNLRDWAADIARLLIQHGADIEVKDASGRTPLELACSDGRAAVAGVLLKAGANSTMAEEILQKNKPGSPWYEERQQIKKMISLFAFAKYGSRKGMTNSDVLRQVSPYLQ